MLLLVIAVLLPWVVHMAPPRHRPLALVAVIAVLILYTVLRTNAFTGWELWAGLAVGIASVVFFGPGRRGGSAPEDRRPASPWEDDIDGPHATGEFSSQV